MLAAPVSVTPPGTQSPVYYSDTTPYKTPPSSPSSIIHPSHEAKCARAEEFLSDLPTIPVIPVLPTSPTTASYKKLLNNVASSKVGRPSEGLGLGP